jgi:hypothetical protein
MAFDYEKPIVQTVWYDKDGNEVEAAVAAVFKDGAVERDGILTVSVQQFGYDMAGTKGLYAGSVTNSVTANDTNYVYLDSTGTLQVNTTGYPGSSVIHIRLARVVTDVLDVTNIYQDRAFFTAGTLLDSAGDVDGPASSVDNAIARFNGTTGKIIQNSVPTIDNNGRIQGAFIHPPGTSDPSSPTPQNGDRYYNITLQMWMTYDESRSKWLSESMAIFQFGRNGSTPSGGYYRGVNGLTFSATIGYVVPWNGTVVGAGYSRSDTDNADFELTDDGTTIVAGNSTAVSGYSNSLDANFTQGSVLAARNGGPNATTDVQGWFLVKWRA